MNILSTIASGLAGWLTYEDMLRNVRHHEEATLHDPIREIAKANGYSVKREFPLPRVQGQLGGSKKVDFVLASTKSKEYVVLELKFKKTALAMAGSVTSDAKKIARVDADIINEIVQENPAFGLPVCGQNWTIRRAALLVWREGDVAQAMLSKKEHPIIRKQLVTVLKGICADPASASPSDVAAAMLKGKPLKPVSIASGHLRFGSTLTRKRYWIGILNYRDAWLKI